jgi:Arc/MetJ-type ribon-helix-helix transcriptional regulator
MVKCNIGWYAGSKIPQILNEAIKEAVNTGNYLNSSDFIRDAIKEKKKNNRHQY